MPDTAHDHDPFPAAPDPDPAPDREGATVRDDAVLDDAVLDDAVRGVRVHGAIFLRAEYSESWAYESMSTRDVTDLLAPGEERVVLFHVVADGACWIETAPGERLWAGPGDVIVLPYGDRHRMGGRTEAVAVPIRSILQPPPWPTMPVIRYGAGGPTTNVVCGYLSSHDPLFDPAMRALPSVFVVTPPPGPAGEWVRASIDFALGQTSRDADGRYSVSPRLPELLLAEVLRLHLASAPSGEHGLLRALRDPVLAPALAALHGDPSRHWSVADLAARSHVSVSALDERFRQVLSVPPIRYLFQWRMHVARGLLANGELGVGAVARRVGYESEEAFSRAFKREHGSSPRAWRESVRR
ncbi:AraC family transcriptional regulator [Cellulomonas chitinilytica]|uniref:AraC family transcriptional regulator n=1 Tax=Cellulomonas chitinilytica TaxID=398759 RepID=UPI00194370C0|nr:AraC family transcriptional regulator [Cellulomonas chitinilytica]